MKKKLKWQEAKILQLEKSSNTKKIRQMKDEVAIGIKRIPNTCGRGCGYCSVHHHCAIFQLMSIFTKEEREARGL
jgi:hypothetical protein